MQASEDCEFAKGKDIFYNSFQARTLLSQQNPMRIPLIYEYTSRLLKFGKLWAILIHLLSLWLSNCNTKPSTNEKK